MGMGTTWESGGSSMRPCSAQRYAVSVSKLPLITGSTGMPRRPPCCPHTCRFHGRIFFSKLRVEVIRIWQPEDGVIKMR